MFLGSIVVRAYLRRGGAACCIVHSLKIQNWALLFEVRIAEVMLRSVYFAFLPWPDLVAS